MNGPQILNLDALVTAAKVITIGGVSYEMVEQSVQDFVDMVRDINKLEKLKKQTGDESTKHGIVAEELAQMLDIVRRAFPSMPDEVVKRLSFTHLTRVIEFIQADTEALAAQATPDVAPDAQPGEGAQGNV